MGLKVTDVKADNLQNPGKKTVTGIVLDVEGNPLIGVSVAIKGTGTGTVTDLEGKYASPSVSSSDVLTFSYIGYQPYDVEVKDLTVHNVILREASVLLEDVVVVGYGTQKKVSVTGALSTINVTELLSVPTANFSNSIGGHLPGLITRQTSGEPGFDGAQIFVRGMSTWTGNRAPLVLVDGVERDINLVNPLEVENFTILKDASATAVYGVRGANGVILINTKKGIKQAPKVTFRSEWAVLTGMRFPNYINGYEFASLMNEASENMGRAKPWTDEDLTKFRDHSDPYLHPDVNWTDEVYRKNAMQAVNNLGIRGGTESVRYYVNAGFTKQSGLYNEDKSLDYRTNADVNRFNFRSNVDVNVTKDLVVDLGLGAIIQKRDYQGTPAQTIYNATRQISPISYPVTNPDGSIAGGPSYMLENPWALTTQSGYTNMYQNTIQGTFGIKWDLSTLVTQGLSLSGRFAFDAWNHTEIFRTIPFGVYQYTGKNDAGEDQYTEIRAPGTMGSRVENAGNRSTYWDLSLNYNRSFGDGKHDIAAMLLFNQREFVNIQAANEIQNIPERHQGLAGRLSYDYDNRYLAEFNFGYNGSEQFPKGKRYGFFPSLSLGWILTGENFWKIDLINHLKIRASYGMVGNDDLRINNEKVRFLYQTRMNKTAWGYFWGPGHSYTGDGIQEDQIGAENITWETSTKSNVGLDIGLWNSQLTLQADVFFEMRDNILVGRGVIPDFTGIIAVPYGNVGKAQNYGFDGMIEYKKLTPTGFYYSFKGNFSFARNKILEDDRPEPLWPNLDTKGQRIFQDYGFIALGIFQSQEEIDNSPKQVLMDVVRPGDLKYKDVNEDGVVDQFDKTPIGYGQTPEIMFGFGGTVAYKGFDFTVYFTGAANRSTFLDGTGMWPYSLEYPNYNIFREYYDNRWIPGAADNSKAKYPAAIAGQNVNTQQVSTAYMRDASYVRLQNAEIGYTLPTSILEQIKIEKIRLFLNGTNLYVWDKVKIVDPEMTQTGTYPMQRVVNLGVQIDF
ncbi:MAG: TonB-dependent receptor [Tannerella sp.]|nr:TonB-dependent receptor [Tannerella sp.]